MTKQPDYPLNGDYLRLSLEEFGELIYSIKNNAYALSQNDDPRKNLIEAIALEDRVIHAIAAYSAALDEVERLKRENAHPCYCCREKDCDEGCRCYRLAPFSRAASARSRRERGGRMSDDFENQQLFDLDLTPDIYCPVCGASYACIEWDDEFNRAHCLACDNNFSIDEEKTDG